MKNIKYRTASLYYDEQSRYYIERSVNGDRYRFLFGNLTYEEAQWYLRNPDQIERKRVEYKVTMICVAVFIILFIVGVVVYG